MAMLLSADPVHALTVRNERFKFIWYAGAADLHDGLIRNRELYYQTALDLPKGAKGLLIATLPIVVVGSALFLKRFFRPWTKRTLHESKVVAEVRLLTACAIARRCAELRSVRCSRRAPP